MNDDLFNTDDFMNSSVEGVGSTTVTPIPAGTYMALIGNSDNAITLNAYDRKDGQPGKVRQLSVTFELLDEAGTIKAQIDGREPKHTQGYFLDITPDGKFDNGKGKNVGINKLRDALGQNSGGPWNPNMLRGAGPLQVQIVVEPDKKDASILRNRIKAVGAANAQMK